MLGSAAGGSSVCVRTGSGALTVDCVCVLGGGLLLAGWGSSRCVPDAQAIKYSVATTPLGPPCSQRRRSRTGRKILTIRAFVRYEAMRQGGLRPMTLRPFVLRRLRPMPSLTHLEVRSALCAERRARKVIGECLRDTRLRNVLLVQRSKVVLVDRSDGADLPGIVIDPT